LTVLRQIYSTNVNAVVESRKPGTGLEEVGHYILLELIM